MARSTNNSLYGIQQPKGSSPFFTHPAQDEQTNRLPSILMRALATALGLLTCYRGSQEQGIEFHAIDTLHGNREPNRVWTVPSRHLSRRTVLVTIIRIAFLLLWPHFVAWGIVFVMFVGFSPALVFGYFTMAWSFSAGELPMLVWFYSWGMFVVLVGAFFVLKRLLAKRRTDGAP
jgi:hypothetical protein